MPPPSLAERSHAPTDARSERLAATGGTRRLDAHAVDARVDARNRAGSACRRRTRVPSRSAATTTWGSRTIRASSRRSAQAARRWGVGSGASHLVSGHGARASRARGRARRRSSAVRARCCSRPATWRTSRVVARARRSRRPRASRTGSTTPRCSTRGLLPARDSRAIPMATSPHCGAAARSATSAAQAGRRPTASSAWTATSRRCRELAALRDATTRWLLVDDAHGFGVLGANGRGIGRGTRARARRRAGADGHARQGRRRVRRVRRGLARR